MSLVPSGLINPTVNCWLNALVQALASCQPFCTLILNEYVNHKSNLLFAEFYKFIYAGVNGWPMQNASANIIKAIKKIQKKTQFNAEVSAKQQCVDEFFCMLIEALDEPKITELFSIKVKYLHKCESCGHVDESTGVHLRRHILESPQSEKDFVQCILGDQSELDYSKCSKCEHVSHDIVRIEKVVNLPRVLCVMFDKIISRKIVHIRTDWMIMDKYTSNIYKYSLVSRVNHYGDNTGGHYVTDAIRRGPKNTLQWYNLNDEIITPLKTFDNIPSDNTFMTFYVMGDCRPPNPPQLD